MHNGRSPWLALVLSAAIHGGLGLVVFLGVASDEYGTGVSPFALESCVFVQDGVAANGGSTPVPARTHPEDNGANEEQQVKSNGTFTATVTDLSPRPPANDGTAGGQKTTTGAGTIGLDPKAGNNGPVGTNEVGVAFCGVSGKGNRVVYVIDRSLSMGLNGTFRHACDQLLKSLEDLPAEARFQVILYNRHAEPLRVNGSAELLAADAETRDQVSLLVRRARSEGATDHLQALKAALRLHPDVIYLATDADDLTRETIEAATLYNKGKTVIHTVEVTRWLDVERTSLMKQLAKSNGGTYRAVVVSLKPD